MCGVAALYGLTPSTISFDAIPNQILGVSPFPIVAQASSRLPVTIMSTTTSVCTTSGTLVTLLTAGSCSLTATQNGNGTYLLSHASDQNLHGRGCTPFRLIHRGARQSVPRRHMPFVAAVADFNNDGIQDLATSDRSGNISVLLGNGSGGFAAVSSSPFPTGGGSIAIGLVTGDFNGDGNQDIAVANYQNGTITVMLGNGKGALSVTVSSPIATGSYPAAMVVSAISTAMALTIWRWRIMDTTMSPSCLVMAGAASRWPVLLSRRGRAPEIPAVGDFNGDGIQDLAVADVSGNAVTILLGNGSGGFTATAASPITVGSVPLAVVAGDFNHDGHQDIAVANQGDSTVTVLLGNGAGVFTAASRKSVRSGAQPLRVGCGRFQPRWNHGYRYAERAG